MDLFISERRFEMFRWRTGHTGLVLRTFPLRNPNDVIEIMFKPAFAASLPSVLDGVRIADASELDERDDTCLTRPLKDYEHRFAVQGSDYRGWVIASAVYGLAADRSNGEPLFDGWGDRAGVRKLFSHQRLERRPGAPESPPSA